MIARASAVAGMLLTGLVLASPPADAGPVRVSFAGGRLTVLGTSADNMVTITRMSHGIRVDVDGKTVKLRPRPKPDTLNSIKVKGKGGNDVLTLVETAGPLPDASLQGGLGDDRLTGGSGATRLVGKAGNDVLIGGAGPTFMDGGDGADTFTGGSGPTTMTGGAGNDTLTAGTGNGQLDGGDGNDLLVVGRGLTSLAGGAGDDTYAVDADTASGLLSIEEAAGAGHDTVDFSGSTAGATLDLSSTATQSVTGNLLVKLSSGTGVEDAVGGAGNDGFTGNTAVNRFTGGGGKDTYTHHGSGDGVDVATDMVASQGDQVLFSTGGALSAADLTVNAAATQLRDVATGTFGFDFAAPVINGTAFYIFGRTDTSPQGQLIHFNGPGGLSQGSNVDSLIVTTATNGSTIGAAGLRDRIVDYSPNGNSLIGRDGSDVLLGGDGADTLQGDRGFSPGVADSYTGGNGADTFAFGEAFGGGTLEKFGADTITDFGTGADTADLFTGLSVRSGLGTTTVTIWDGATDFGTITASNGHLWAAGDFS